MGSGGPYCLPPLPHLLKAAPAPRRQEDNRHKSQVAKSKQADVAAVQCKQVPLYDKPVVVWLSVLLWLCVLYAFSFTLFFFCASLYDSFYDAAYDSISVQFTACIIPVPCL